MGVLLPLAVTVLSVLATEEVNEKVQLSCGNNVLLQLLLVTIKLDEGVILSPVAVTEVEVFVKVTGLLVVFAVKLRLFGLRFSVACWVLVDRLTFN